MIEMTIDSSRLDAKIRALTQRLASSIELGLQAGTTTLAKDIDEIMFVPLAFDPSVSQNTTNTVATMNVSLNIPRRIVRNRKQYRNQRFFAKHVKAKPLKSWTDYVQDISRSSPVVTNAVASAIKKELR